MRLERFMAGRGLWDDEYGSSVKARAETVVDGAVLAMEAVPPPDAAEMFEHVLARPASRQDRQRGGL
jgi:pyruvate dehydrogenase E1 component alpha subunit